MPCLTTSACRPLQVNEKEAGESAGWLLQWGVQGMAQQEARDVSQVALSCSLPRALLLNNVASRLPACLPSFMCFPDFNSTEPVDYPCSLQKVGGAAFACHMLV